MEILEFMQMVCIPAFAWLVYVVSKLKEELAAFKIKVTEDESKYATNEALLRMEAKIDGLRDLIIDVRLRESEKDGTRYKKNRS